MEVAFESSDYGAWYDLMTEDSRHPRVVDVVTASNFDTFAAAHTAAENGDYESAANLRAELGLNNGNGPQDGNSHKMGQGERQQRHRNNCDDGNCGNMESGQGKGKR